MKLVSFFKSLVFNLFAKAGKPLSKAAFVAAHRKLQREPGLQALAQELGNQRRLDAWLRSVQDGYDHKRQLVEAGKGRNTLAGIPA